MSLELCVLGSGSSGNSTVVRSPWGSFLLDAGFGPRATAERMLGIGLTVPDLSAIVLTHLDSDHFNWNWLQTILKLQIRIFCARSRVTELLKNPEIHDVERKLDAKHAATHPCRRFADLITPFDDTFSPVQNVRINALALAHDHDGSHGFVIECDGCRVGFATDLGHVPGTLIDSFQGMDLIALESNYDPDMEKNSDRPWYLKQRVMGGHGHLSNEQALEALQAILDRTTEIHGPERLPRHIVLLHRSRQCNCPKLVKKLFTRDPRISRVLTLADQHEPTPWLSARYPRALAVRQLALSFV